MPLVPNQPDLRAHAWPAAVSLHTNITQWPLPQTAALRLENWWPQGSYLVPRGGMELRFDLGGAQVRQFAEYPFPLWRGIIRTADALYTFDGSEPPGTALTTAVTGLADKLMCFVPRETVGGRYVVAVNGHNYMRIYDGTDWHIVTSTSSPFSVLGIDTRLLSWCWTFKTRLWFIERGSTSAWYSQPNAIAGELREFKLAPVLRRGGVLVSGATISSDTGDGLDDRCVFITSQGEVVVYDGLSPDDAGQWRLAGVYQAAPLVQPDALVRVGGDLVMLTVDGPIALSDVMASDQAVLRKTSFFDPINDIWRQMLSTGGTSNRWYFIKDDRHGMLLTTLGEWFGDTPFILGFNLATRQITKLTGWPTQALGLVGGALYGADSAGRIYTLDTGGRDAGNAYECIVWFAPQMLSGAGTELRAEAVRALMANTAGERVWLGLVADNDLAALYGEYVAPAIQTGTALWDVALWDVSYWGSAAARKEWEIAVNVRRSARLLAPAVHVRIDSEQQPKLELHMAQVEYRAGGLR